MCVLKRVHVIASVGTIPRDGTRSETGQDGFFKGTSYLYIAGWSGTGRDGMGQVFSKDHGIVPTLVSANAHARVLPLGADKMHDASK